MQVAPSPNAFPVGVRKQMARDGKQAFLAPAGVFWAYVTVMVPVWVTIILPLSLIHQSLKALYERLFPPEKFTPISPFDSCYQTEAEDIISRPKRKYDVVLMGATGFVGKLAARYLAKNYGVGGDVKWALAGRSQSKLDETKKALADDLNMDEILSVDCIVADTSIPSTLPKVVRDSRVVLSTVGPFWNYGSSIVEFCAKFGTHYADITGETSWVRNMIERWKDTAQSTGAKMISLAGHDSIPWDLSVSMVAKRLKEEADEDLESVTCFDEVRGGVSGGTLATIMLVFGGPAHGRPKSDPFRLRPDGTTHNKQMEGKIKLFPSELQLPWGHKREYGSPYLMSAINLDVVSWSQALRGGAPLTYTEVMVNPDFKTAFVSYFSLVLLLTGLLNPITKSILFKFLLPKPGEGPSIEEMEKNSFLAVTTQGTGTGGSMVEASMYFPRDAGYMDTARMLVESGLCMALEEESLPVKIGGFFSPGYCLGEILLKRLTETGTYFQSAVSRRKSR